MQHFIPTSHIFSCCLSDINHRGLLLLTLKATTSSFSSHINLYFRPATMSDVVDPYAACYYSVLGINKQATDCEIRGAYRKMALKWHPDRWSWIKDPDLVIEAKTRFQQIQEAYLLSNKGKRTIYDAGLFGLIGDDDDEGFVDFMQEMVLMTHTENPQEYTLEDLERLLMDMMENHSEGTAKSEFQATTTPSKKIRTK